MTLFTPLTLPNGTLLPNRIAKAAMEENLASFDNAPSQALFTLYDTWAKGGAGLIISGNVMIERRAMTGPGGVVLDNLSNLNLFKHWAQIAQSNGAQCWLQLNHPGRQMPKDMGQTTYAPSAVALDLGKFSNRFSVPQAMTDAHIETVIQQFAHSAKLAEDAGFSGIQIHAAHGYLLSQFLSPLTNKRTDQWGGSISNRARLLLLVIQAVKAVVRAGFAVSVKLNSADFQRGGFSSDDATAVVQMLNTERIDLLELSGGSYEAPAMQGEARDGSTLAREAYFLEFAKALQQHATMPVMVTGGIRRKAVAEQVLSSGIDMVGIATALAIEPALATVWQQNETTSPAMPVIRWKSKPMASLATMAMVKYQLSRLSRGKPSQQRVSPIWALLLQQFNNWQRTRRYRLAMQDTQKGK
ncbi:NADH:flavin oxidoreductase/NADH oxidase family protein [Aestuariibacter sp. GS-14]|uniref:NADH:flavin oxidoreductase/NADH oxidase family protein n=1 Tax=Aestuariibacter sp. GS-14 TaxID=2590670 RepID=UPI00112D1D3F|nr:NADH:flavin oxidoreductase/NADH oxidase family protein [Aestuariibacter sp. GS-14]